MIGTNKLLASIAFTTVCVLSSGCGRNGFSGNSDFDMPPSLIDRMRVSYNCDRARRTGSAETLDGEEMMALMQLGYDKAYEIAARPRGDMVFRMTAETKRSGASSGHLMLNLSRRLLKNRLV